MSYRHFSLVERSQIELMQQQGLSRAEMARVLGRHPSSIGRELRRNGGARGYCAMRALWQASHRVPPKGQAVLRAAA